MQRTSRAKRPTDWCRCCFTCRTVERCESAGKAIRIPTHSMAVSEAAVPDRRAGSRGRDFLRTAMVANGEKGKNYRSVENIFTDFIRVCWRNAFYRRLGGRRYRPWACTGQPTELGTSPRRHPARSTEAGVSGRMAGPWGLALVFLDFLGGDLPVAVFFLDGHQ